MEEFKNIIEHENAAICLHDVGVDVVNLADFSDMIFDNFTYNAKNRESQHRFASEAGSETGSETGSENDVRRCACGDMLPQNMLFCLSCGKRWVPGGNRV